MPLKVLIVGAGLGGLAAAFRLALDGHDVVLYEKRSSFVPKGGGIMIRPNATRFLIQWGLQEDFEAVSDVASATAFRTGHDSTLMRRQPVTTFSSPDLGCSRTDAMMILHRQAVEAGARIQFGVSIVDVAEDETSATAKLSNRETIKADIVLAADGILSALRPKILGSDPRPNVGWTSAHQVQLEGDMLVSDPDAKRLTESDDLTIFMKPGGGGYMVGRYSEKSRRYGAFLGIPEVDNSSPKLWDEHGDIDYVREYFKDYDPSIRAVLRMANSCDRWRLAEMPDLPRWISKHGRLLLLGDSAHAMFPDAAQGFSQILEDIAALSYLLSIHGKSKIHVATDIWQQVRIPRVNRIKAWANFNTSLYTKGAGPSKGSGPAPRGAKQRNSRQPPSDDVEPDMHAHYPTPQFMKWAFGYDAVDEVKKFISSRDKSARL